MNIRTIFKSYKMPLAAVLLGASLAAGCKKFIEVDVPITRVASDNVYEDNNLAASVLTYAYARISDNLTGGAEISSIEMFAEMMADNLVYTLTTDANNMAYAQNNFGAAPNRVKPAWWYEYYTHIYPMNAAVEGITQSKGMTNPVKDRILGEAKFMRAFYYYYLVTMYGDVPLVLTTDYTATSSMARTPKEQVFQQIVADLKDAKALMADDYYDATLLTVTQERTRPNKWAATALLARAYLYTGNFDLAEAEASELINNTAKFDLLPLNEVFLKNSKETIWSLQTVPDFQNTWQGRVYPLTAAGPNRENPFYLAPSLISEFDEEDQRLHQWIDSVQVGGKGYYYAYKYKAGVIRNTYLEYNIVLRLAEQYLIRAEARTHLGKLTGSNSASEDLSEIRGRAGLQPISISSQPDMMDSILVERRREMFTEWAHRWLDMKRMGKIDEIMPAASVVKGGTWEPYKALLPIPQEELNANPAMRDQQNPGY